MRLTSSRKAVATPAQLASRVPDLHGCEPREHYGRGRCHDRREQRHAVATALGIEPEEPIHEHERKRSAAEVGDDRGGEKDATRGHGK